MTHKIKILNQYYDAISPNGKNFEIRLNDRDYQKGDIVEMSEIEKLEDGIIVDGKNFIYTGRFITATIGHVSTFEQKNGWVVFSLIGIKKNDGETN